MNSGRGKSGNGKRQYVKKPANNKADQRQREKVYFPQYNKIYVALNDSNKTKWRVTEKAQGPS